MKKSIFLLITLAVLGCVYWGYKTYNKEHTNVAETNAHSILSASELFSIFDIDEANGTLKYADQVIQVEGILLRRDLSNDQNPQIILQGNGSDGFIRCGFKKEDLDKTEAMTDGSTIKLKGLCKGMNGDSELDLLADRDVVLSNCTIIE